MYVLTTCRHTLACIIEIMNNNPKAAVFCVVFKGVTSLLRGGIVIANHIGHGNRVLSHHVYTPCFVLIAMFPCSRMRQPALVSVNH